MQTKPIISALIDQKVARIAVLRPEFVRSFPFVQHMHGQTRMAQITVPQVVRYLHALWICDCKDRLLGVPQEASRYEGAHCLRLLAEWQTGDAAGVVDFLQRKLDAQPFGAITAQWQHAHEHAEGGALAQRLTAGRAALLNRGMHLMLALEAIFALSVTELTRVVVLACQQEHHTPEELTDQLHELESPLFQLVRHPVLARENMVLMNNMSGSLAAQPPVAPVEESMPRGTEPLAAFLFPVYLASTSTRANNLSGHHFLDAADPVA